MIEGANVDADERGFVLELVGDFSEAIACYEDGSDCILRVRLNQESALALLDTVEREIGPWRSQMREERAAYDAASPEERERVLGGSR